MEKILYYGMTGEKSCFMHVLMNALDLNNSGVEVKIIFEGASVKLVPVFEKESNPLYKKAKELGLIVGVCKACSVQLGVYDEIKDLNLTFLTDMNGHAGQKEYIFNDYKVISM